MLEFYFEKKLEDMGKMLYRFGIVLFMVFLLAFLTSSVFADTCISTSPGCCECEILFQKCRTVADYKEYCELCCDDGGHGDRKCEFRVLENCEICRGREDL